jgi:hypothetical protein
VTVTPAIVLPRLLAFVDVLRRNGVRAAEAEVQDALAALSTLGSAALATRADLRAVLLTTLAKSAAEEELVAELFDLTFGGAARDGEDDAARLEPLLELLARQGVSPEDAAAWTRDVEASLDDADPALAALIDGDAGALDAALRQALEDSDIEGLSTTLQVGYFTQRLLARVGHGRLEAAFASAAGRKAMSEAGAGGHGRHEPTSGEPRGALFELEQRLRRAARRAVERELSRRTVSRRRRSDLLDRDLRSVSSQELEVLRAHVTRLAEKLKTRLAVRRRRSRRGRLDVRRTLRAAAGTDGVPMRAFHARKRPRRPELLVLCDVSDSVRQASVFMLELVAALSGVLARTRSFVFVDELVDVTDALRHDARGAVASILSGERVNLSANSDYGRALTQLWRRHGGELTRRTTVLVLGDGRGNYRLPEDWVLGEMRRRARRVLWLSPEERGTWGFGDSEMPRYARHADAIFVVRSAADLARAIDRLSRA